MRKYPQVADNLSSVIHKLVESAQEPKKGERTFPPSVSWAGWTTSQPIWSRMSLRGCLTPEPSHCYCHTAATAAAAASTLAHRHRCSWRELAGRRNSHRAEWFIMFRDSEHASQITECDGGGGGEKEVAGWLLEAFECVGAGGCWWGRVVFSQSSQAISCFCVVVSHKPLIYIQRHVFCVCFTAKQEETVFEQPCGYQQTYLQSIKHHCCLCAHMGECWHGLGQIIRLLKWQMFFIGPFACVFVCVCVCTCTCIHSMHVIVLIGELFAWHSLTVLDWFKVLICFNPDDGCWSVPWAPIKLSERYTNKSGCCQYITLNCRIYWRYFPLAHSHVFYVIHPHINTHTKAQVHTPTCYCLTSSFMLIIFAGCVLLIKSQKSIRNTVKLMHYSLSH